MQQYAAFHLDIHCLQKYPFRGFQYTNDFISFYLFVILAETFCKQFRPKLDSDHDPHCFNNLKWYSEKEYFRKKKLKKKISREQRIKSNYPATCNFFTATYIFFRIYIFQHQSVKQFDRPDLGPNYSCKKVISRQH